MSLYRPYSGSFSAIAALGLLLVSTSALAQVVVPGSARPERASDRLKTVARPAVGVGPVVEPAATPKNVVIKGGTSFALKGVTFEGLGALEEAELQKIVADNVGKKTTFSELQAMTSKLTTHLRNNGYILSRAMLPPQTIEKSGVVKIKIIEGYVNNVSFTGSETADNSLLNAMAEKIRSSKPLRAEDLERYLLLMEDLPGVTARATIQPAIGVVGASDVIINIAQKPIDATATLDNRGSRFLGPVQASASLSANDLFGSFDRTQFRLVSTLFDDELKYGELVHEEQIGSEGTRVLLSGSFADSNIGHTLEPLGVEGQTRTFTAAVRHPFLRSRQSNLYGSLEAVVRDTDVTQTLGRVYNDRTRTLEAAASYDFVDGFQGVNKTDFSAMKGFDLFNTDPAGGLNSRGDGKESFTKLNASVSRLQPLSDSFSLLSAAKGQYAFNPLLASEEFGLGGAEFASAYDASEVTGDHGVAAKLELQYNQYTNVQWLDYYQLYGYYDAGKVWNKGNTSTNDSIPLVSTGLGVRFNALDSVSGSLDFALPINRPVAANGADGEAPRVFFSLAYRY